MVAQSAGGAGETPHAVSDRVFGLVLGSMSGLISLWPLLHSRPPRAWLMAVSLFLLVSAILYPPLLHFPKKGWMSVTLSLSKLVNFVLLAVLFFGVFTPVAIFFRIVRRDVLRLGFLEAVPTYWIQRSDDKIPTDLRRQY